jgi:molybdenum cofactor cytidylyltransferase
MMAKTKFACVILAAGSSVRYGSPKQLAELGEKSLIQTAVDEANNSESDYVFLVLGNSSSEILEKIRLGRAQVIFNKNFAQGISTSIKSGISNLPDDTIAAIIMVADQPFLSYKHLNVLIEKSKEFPGRIVALSFRGEPRNPVVIPVEFSKEIETLSGDEGAKILVRGKSNTVLIDVPDRRVFFDVDTKDSLMDLQKTSKN